MTSEIGDRINKIIGKLADANGSLKGAINAADFNDEEKLGKGKVELDHRDYPKGIKVPDDVFTAINLIRDDFHGDWNYSISPRPDL